MENTPKTYTAHYGYKKNGFQHDFTALNIQEANKMAKEYEIQDNKGEAKSDRIRFKSIKLKQN